jgi:importin-7
LATELQQEQPQLYESLTTNLNPDEQTIVQGVVHQAEANAQAAAAAAAAGIAQIPGVVVNGAQ